MNTNTNDPLIWVFPASSTEGAEVGALVDVKRATEEQRNACSTPRVELRGDEEVRQHARDGAQAWTDAMRAGEKTVTISVEAFAAAFAMYAGALQRADVAEKFAADVSTTFGATVATLAQMGVTVVPTHQKCGATVYIDKLAGSACYATRHVHPAPDMHSVVQHLMMEDLLNPAEIEPGLRPVPHTAPGTETPQ